MLFKYLIQNLLKLIPLKKFSLDFLPYLTSITIFVGNIYSSLNNIARSDSIYLASNLTSFASSPLHIELKERAMNNLIL